MEKWTVRTECAKQFRQDGMSVSTGSSSSSSSSSTSTATTSSSLASTQKPSVRRDGDRSPRKQALRVRESCTSFGSGLAIADVEGASVPPSACVQLCKSTSVVADKCRKRPATGYIDWRYVTSFHGFLKATALVGCLGAVSCLATANQCWFEAGMSMHLLVSISTISSAWTIVFYGGHLISFQRRRLCCMPSTKAIALVFMDVVLSAASFVSMIVAGFVTAYCGCRIERTSIVGSAGFSIAASVSYFINFTWLTWKYYLDCNIVTN